MYGEFVVGVKAVLAPREGCSIVVDVLSNRRRSVVLVFDKYGRFGVMMRRLWSWRYWLLRKNCLSECFVAWRHIVYIHTYILIYTAPKS